MGMMIERHLIILRRFFIVLVLMLPAGWANAEVLVLVPGLQGKASSWYESGAAKVLESYGWQRGGDLDLRYGRVVIRASKKRRSPRMLYTVATPSDESLLKQAAVLKVFMDELFARHPDEGFILAGFSVGGLAARMYMVQEGKTRVRTLITIASPHLGTELAELASEIWQSPLGMFEPFLKGVISPGSRVLYAELGRERPGSLLF